MKKWTYLVAAMLTLGSTSVLTGCIDNDEPEGINILRKAKAELITAKKAVAEAEAARLKSEAALNEAKAEVEKAEAEIKKAQAEQIKAETEAEKALLEAQIKEAEAKAQEALNKALQAQYEAEAAGQKALLEIAQAKAAMAEEQARALRTWYNRYDQKLAAYNAAYAEWVGKAQEYTKALTNAENQATDNIQQTRTYEWDVAEKEAALAQANAKLESLEAALEAAQTMEPSGLLAKEESLLAELAAANDKVAAVEVEKAEFRRENIAEYNKVDELQAAYNDVANKNLEVERMSIELNEGVPTNLKTDDYVIIYGWNYQVGDEYAHNQVVADFDRAIKELRGLTLDENDLAWNAQSLIDLKNRLAVEEKSYAAQKAVWSNAVAAYNTADGSVDITAYAGYADLKAAIEKLNVPAATYKAQVDAEKAAKDERKAAVDAYNEAKTLIQIYDDKEKALTTAAEDKSEEIWDKVDQNIANAEANIQSLSFDARAKSIALQQAEYNLSLNPSSTALATIVDNARKASADADKKLADAETELANNRTKWTADAQKEVDKINGQLDIDLQSLELEYDKALADYGNEQKDPALWAAIEAADKKIATAQAEQDKAQDAMQKVMDSKAFTDARDKYLASVDYSIAQMNLLYNVNAIKAPLDVNKVLAVTRTQAEWLVVRASRDLFGFWYAYNDQDNEFGLNSEYLLEPSYEDLMNIIRENVSADIKDYQLPGYYGNFGAYGSVLDVKNQIALAESYIDNPKAMAGYIAEVEEMKAAVIAQYTEAKAAVDEAEAAVKAQYDVIDALEKPLADKLAAAQAERELIYPVLYAVQTAIRHSSDDADGMNSSDIAFYKELLQTEIDAMPKQIYDAETDLQVAKKALEDWLAGDLDAVENAKNAMDNAEWKKDQAKAALDEAKEQLERVMAFLETATAE